MILCIRNIYDYGFAVWSFSRGVNCHTQSTFHSKLMLTFRECQILVHGVQRTLGR